MVVSRIRENSVQCAVDASQSKEVVECEVLERELQQLCREAMQQLKLSGLARRRSQRCCLTAGTSDGDGGPFDLGAPRTPRTRIPAPL